MRARWTGRLPVVCLSVLALLATGGLGGSPASVVLATSPTPASVSPRIDFAWKASVGTGGANGSATVRAFDTARGSAILSLRGLTPSVKYAVTIRRGACGSLGTRVVTVGTFTSTKAGAIAATVPLTVAQVAALRGVAVGTTRVSVVVGSGAQARCGTLAKSRAVTPQVWFAPLAPIPPQPWRPYIGATDWKALFAADAPWPRVAGRTHVFKYYTEWIDPRTTGGPTDAEMRREVAALKARDIAIAIEASPLVVEECGGGEGFGPGAADVVRIIRRIVAAGGSVRYIALDEPVAGGAVNDGKNGCSWPLERTARQVADFVRGVHAVYPSIVVGDIEPWPYVSTELLGRWLDAYEKTAGSPLPFLHLDLDWQALGTDWPARVRAVKQDARSHGTRFGLIYNGGHETTDAAWLAAAEEHLLAFEIDGDGPPDDVIFQSWYEKPDRSLPEAGPSTFTHLIADYVRTRTTVTVAGAPATTGATIAVTGTVRTLGGDLVAGGTVTFAATPRDGPYQVLEARGTVPKGMTRALIGIRTNTEGAGPGTADITVYEIGYTEGAETTSRVQNGRFDGGAWDHMGTASFTSAPSDRGAGSMLRAVATPTQWIMSNSAEFAVTPGAAYRLWLAVRVPEASIGSTVAGIIFLGADGVETERRMMSLTPAPIPAGSTTVDEMGAFSLATSRVDAGRYLLTATYSGGKTYWPARARTEVTVP
ncbi:MAG: hypothetical protein MUE82_13480 [Chloroflexi bacterium]|jgi:hypothetical protein|nr:hypothetical protein [Chloroflexota bacterium]